MMCPAQGQKCPWVEVCVSPVCALRGWRSLHTRVVVNVSFSSLFSYSSLLSCLPFIPFHTVSVILSHILLILFFISVPHSFSCSPFSFPSSPSLSLYPHLSFLFSPFNSTPLSFSLRPSLCPTHSFLIKSMQTLICGTLPSSHPPAIPVYLRALGPLDFLVPPHQSLSRPFICTTVIKITVLHPQLNLATASLHF